MSDYRAEAATKEEWAERCRRAEDERDRLREKVTSLYVGIIAIFALFGCGALVFMVIALA